MRLVRNLIITSPFMQGSKQMRQVTYGGNSESDLPALDWWMWEANSVNRKERNAGNRYLI